MSSYYRARGATHVSFDIMRTSEVATLLTSTAAGVRTALGPKVSCGNCLQPSSYFLSLSLFKQARAVTLGGAWVAWGTVLLLLNRCVAMAVVAGSSGVRYTHVLAVAADVVFLAPQVLSVWSVVWKLLALSNVQVNIMAVSDAMSPGLTFAANEHCGERGFPHHGEIP